MCTAWYATVQSELSKAGSERALPSLPEVTLMLAFNLTHVIELKVPLFKRPRIVLSST